MDVRVGTSGYSYKEWKGSFYPQDLPASRMLTYYAERFPTVEINATFYRMPKPAMLAKWATEVPKTFTFVLKAPQRLTHHKRLVDCKDDLAYFIDAARVLGPQLGPLLFQLPPYFRADVAKLSEFLALLPSDVRTAWEFRHASWFTEETYSALRAHRAALCAADTDDAAEAAPIVPTTSWGYLRLRRVEYDAASLVLWRDRVLAQGWRDAFVFFKHEDAGTGPRLGAEFMKLFSEGHR